MREEEDAAMQMCERVGLQTEGRCQTSDFEMVHGVQSTHTTGGGDPPRRQGCEVARAMTGRAGIGVPPRKRTTALVRVPTTRLQRRTHMPRSKDPPLRPWARGPCEI